MEWGEEMFASIDSLAEEDSTPEEPVEEEAQEIDYEEGAPQALTHFSGFRDAFFEASQESQQREARRLGWNENEWSQEVLQRQRGVERSTSPGPRPDEKTKTKQRQRQSKDKAKQSKAKANDACHPC